MIHSEETEELSEKMASHPLSLSDSWDEELRDEPLFPFQLVPFGDLSA